MKVETLQQLLELVAQHSAALNTLYNNMPQALMIVSPVEQLLR
jgi:hypothetical protein